MARDDSSKSGKTSQAEGVTLAGVNTDDAHMNVGLLGRAPQPSSHSCIAVSSNGSAHIVLACQCIDGTEDSEWNRDRDDGKEAGSQSITPSISPKASEDEASVEVEKDGLDPKSIRILLEMAPLKWPHSG